MHLQRTLCVYVFIFLGSEVSIYSSQKLQTNHLEEKLGTKLSKHQDAKKQLNFG